VLTSGPSLERLARHGETVVLPGLRAGAPEAIIVTEQHIHAPGLAPDPGSLPERLAMRLAGRNAARAVSFATEAGLFQGHGAPAIVCGPGHIAQAHQPDEYVEISQLDACEAFMRRLLEEARRGIS
jgi:acetylornithine deacetylase